MATIIEGMRSGPIDRRAGTMTAELSVRTWDDQRGWVRLVRFAEQAVGITIGVMLANDNFKFFALSYLNDWSNDDKAFVDGLLPGVREEDRLKSLLDAANYYRVSRGFPTLKDKPESEQHKRFKFPLDELDKVRTVTLQNVDEVVCKLAKVFKTEYGDNLVAAASKFLWLRHQSPVVIYDGLAFGSIKKLCGKPLVERDYPPYRQQWQLQFTEHEDQIRAACTELVEVKSWSLARLVCDDRIKELVSKLWFRERVFDKYLWWNEASTLWSEGTHALERSGSLSSV